MSYADTGSSPAFATPTTHARSRVSTGATIIETGPRAGTTLVVGGVTTVWCSAAARKRTLCTVGSFRQKRIDPSAPSILKTCVTIVKETKIFYKYNTAIPPNIKTNAASFKTKFFRSNSSFIIRGTKIVNNAAMTNTKIV